MDDLRDQIRRDENALQKLMQAIPGFAGYHEEDVRRSADKLLREHLAGMLEATKSRLNSLQRTLSEGGEFKPATDLSRITRRLMRAHDRIQHASYGYGGFFAAVKVDLAALDRLYDFDLALRETILELDKEVADLKGLSADQLTDRLRALGDVIDELGRLVDTRNNVVSEVAPEG
jgi:hypothetical protein